jgi:hypothetical protein
MQVKRLAPALLLALAACAKPVVHVAQGEAVTTGQTSFDDFFLAVREVRAEALAAANDEEGSHGVLIQALGMGGDAKPAAAIDESGKRAKKLVEKGVLVHLDVAPSARLITARGKAPLDEGGEALLRAWEGSARASLEMRKRFVAVAARAAELEKRRGDLKAEVPKAFGDDGKRAAVTLELDAAQAVLAEAQEKAVSAAGAAARFVVDLAQAVETGAADVKPVKGKKPVFTVQPVSPPPAAVASVAPPQKVQAAAPPPKPPKPAASPPKPQAPAAPPPKKKAKGGDDFEP